jgi:hypothetical protein
LILGIVGRREGRGSRCGRVGGLGCRRESDFVRWFRRGSVSTEGRGTNWRGTFRASRRRCRTDSREKGGGGRCVAGGGSLFNLWRRRGSVLRGRGSGGRRSFEIERGRSRGEFGRGFGTRRGRGGFAWFGEAGRDRDRNRFRGIEGNLFFSLFLYIIQKALLFLFPFQMLLENN